MERISGLTKDKLQIISNATKFRIDAIEKVIRMSDFLDDIFRHPYLKKRLLLKGGTGLNFCYLDKPRISVDIDLNYVGSVDIETMKGERSEISRALEMLISDKGYHILHNPGDEHAGGKWVLRYIDVFGNNKNIEIDLNYMFRCPIGTPVEKAFTVFPGSEKCKVRLVSKEELFAGKIVAALDRSLPRDIYDILKIIDFIDYDKLLLRKSVIFLGVAMRNDFRMINPKEVINIDNNEFNNSLKPLLRSNDNISKDILLETVLPFISKLLEFSNEENLFINDLLDKGIFSPELLFKEYSLLIPCLKKHPALLWKQKNIIKYLDSKK